MSPVEKEKYVILFREFKDVFLNDQVPTEKRDVVHHRIGVKAGRHIKFHTFQYMREDVQLNP